MFQGLLMSIHNSGINISLICQLTALNCLCMSLIFYILYSTWLYAHAKTAIKNFIKISITAPPRDNYANQAEILSILWCMGIYVWCMCAFTLVHVKFSSTFWLVVKMLTIWPKWRLAHFTSKRGIIASVNWMRVCSRAFTSEVRENKR